MKDKDVTGQDLFMVTYGMLPGLGLTIANAIVCEGTWQTIWIVVAVISVISCIVSWFMCFAVKDGFGQLLMYTLYSFVMFFAGCGTAVFTWGEDSWIFVLTFPFGLVGLALAPFAVGGIIFATAVSIYTYFDEVYQPKRKTNRKKAFAI